MSRSVGLLLALGLAAAPIAAHALDAPKPGPSDPRIKVVDYDIDSADWRARVAKSKFTAWPEYATLRTGHIDLQDHGSPVAYRNLRIKVLP